MNHAIRDYRDAAEQVRALRPPVGFEAAQLLLVREYEAQSHAYALTVRLVADHQSGADSAVILTDLERVATVLQVAKRLVPATRRAFRGAAHRAGVRTPAWVPQLAYGSWPHG